MKTRIEVPEEEIRAADKDVMKKLFWRLEQKGPDGYIGPHEMLGILEEERNELVDAIHANDFDGTIEELMDVAVTCLFGIASLRNNRASEGDAQMTT